MLRSPKPRLFPTTALDDDDDDEDNYYHYYRYATLADTPLVSFHFTDRVRAISLAARAIGRNFACQRRPARPLDGQFSKSRTQIAYVKT